MSSFFGVIWGVSWLFWQSLVWLSENHPLTRKGSDEIKHVSINNSVKTSGARANRLRTCDIDYYSLRRVSKFSHTQFFPRFHVDVKQKQRSNSFYIVYHWDIIVNSSKVFKLREANPEKGIQSTVAILFDGLSFLPARVTQAVNWVVFKFSTQDIVAS